MMGFLGVLYKFLFHLCRTIWESQNNDIVLHLMFLTGLVHQLKSLPFSGDGFDWFFFFFPRWTKRNFLSYSLSFKIILTNYWNCRPFSYTHSETFYSKIEVFIWKSKDLNSIISYERPFLGYWQNCECWMPSPTSPSPHVKPKMCNFGNLWGTNSCYFDEKSEVEFIIYFLQNLMRMGLVFKVGLTQISSDVFRHSMQLQCAAGDVDVP